MPRKKRATITRNKNLIKARNANIVARLQRSQGASAIVTAADRPFQLPAGEEEEEEEPNDSDSEIAEQSALDHFTSVLQKAQTHAARAERETPQRKRPRRYDGKSKATLKRRKKCREDLAKHSVFDFLAHVGGKGNGNAGNLQPLPEHERAPDLEESGTFSERKRERMAHRTLGQYYQILTDKNQIVPVARKEEEEESAPEEFDTRLVSERAVGQLAARREEEEESESESESESEHAGNEGDDVRLAKAAAALAVKAALGSNGMQSAIQALLKDLRNQHALADDRYDSEFQPSPLDSNASKVVLRNRDRDRAAWSRAQAWVLDLLREPEGTRMLPSTAVSTTSRAAQIRRW